MMTKYTEEMIKNLEVRTTEELGELYFGYVITDGCPLMESSYACLWTSGFPFYGIIDDTWIVIVDDAKEIESWFGSVPNAFWEVYDPEKEKILAKKDPSEYLFPVQEESIPERYKNI